MNTPNKLTLIRVLLIPVYMLCYLHGGRAGLCLAIVVFLAATLTDNLDGYLARKNHQVTTFGKLMDPLADKMLTMAAFISFVSRGAPYVTAGVVMVILARELIVTGLRLVAVGENKVIAASMWGKAKTVSQFVLAMAVMVFELVKESFPGAAAFCDGFILLAVAVTVILTVYSGFDYIRKNWSLVKFK